jgi:hypothetical protein
MLDPPINDRNFNMGWIMDVQRTARDADRTPILATRAACRNVLSPAKSASAVLLPNVRRVGSVMASRCTRPDAACFKPAQALAPTAGDSASGFEVHTTCDRKRNKPRQEKKKTTTDRIVSNRPRPHLESSTPSQRATDPPSLKPRNKPQSEQQQHVGT